MSHTVYIIECENGNYYTGYTIDIERRYQEHLTGNIKCKYTRAFPPKKLVAVWEFTNKTDALSFEYRIKMLSREKKQKMITRSTSNVRKWVPI